MLARLGRAFALTVIIVCGISTASCGSANDGLRATSDATPAPTGAATSVATEGAPTLEPDTTETASPSSQATVPLATPVPSASSEPTTNPEATATVPPPCRQVAISPGGELTPQDLAGRGGIEPIRASFAGVNLVIRKISVDAPFVVRVVGPDGKMPDPQSATEVDWYDFAQWPGLGGSPGTDRGNVVVAGKYDFQYVPQAVLNRLSELVPGDLIQINMSDGRGLAYEVEFNKTTPVDGGLWDAIVAATPEESITLITAGGPGPNHPLVRIVWGRASTTACTR